MRLNSLQQQSLKPIKRLESSELDQDWAEAQSWAHLAWLELGQLFHDVVLSGWDCDVLLSKKQYASAKEKVARKGYSYMQFPDLVRGAILTNNLDEAIEVVGFLLCHSEVVKWEVKVGSADNPYRGAFHLDIKLGELTCEIQVMSKKTWKVKKEAHVSYKAGKPEEAAPLWASVESFSQEQLELLGV